MTYLLNSLTPARNVSSIIFTIQHDDIRFPTSNFEEVDLVWYYISTWKLLSLNSGLCISSRWQNEA